MCKPNHSDHRQRGCDLREEPALVRLQLGVVFQTPSVDLQLSVKENLVHQGHLYGLRGRELARQIEAGLERFGLGERRNELVRKLSGGLRRRVEIVKALMHRPRLLLLDEPSTGLDPGARRELWRVLEELRAEQEVTVLLTTHFMEEGGGSVQQLSHDDDGWLSLHRQLQTIAEQRRQK